MTLLHFLYKETSVLRGFTVSPLGNLAKDINLPTNIVFYLVASVTSSHIARFFIIWLHLGLNHGRKALPFLFFPAKDEGSDSSPEIEDPITPHRKKDLITEWISVSLSFQSSIF